MPGDPSDFDLEQPTPTGLIEVPADPPRTDLDVVRELVVAQGVRLTAIEVACDKLNHRLLSLEKDLDAHRFRQQWRRLRKYLAVWLKED